MSLLDEVRAGLANPFADSISVGATVLTRAEARAIERALGRKTAVRVVRLPLVTIVWRGVEVLL